MSTLFFFGENLSFYLLLAQDERWLLKLKAST